MTVRNLLWASNAIIAPAMVAFSLVAAPGVQAAEIPAPVSIGPLRTGMTLEELRAAVPQAEWTVNAGGFMDSKDDRTYRAAAVMNLDGLTYDARITQGWYGAYKLQLVQKAQQRNESACVKVYEGMVTELETRFGSFSASGEEYQEESILIPPGNRPPRTTTHQAGKSSGYTLHGTDQYYEASSRLAHPSGELGTVGQYFVHNRWFGDSMCITSFTIEIKGNPPAFEEIAAAELKRVRAPSVGTMHNSLDGVTLPAGGITVKARCRIVRKSGEVGSCEYDSKPSTEISNALLDRIEETGFDIANLSVGNPVPLFTRLEFRLNPKERLDLGTPTTPLAADDIDWSSVDDSIPGRSSINVSPGSFEQKFYTATATADCQVQADGSLACLKIDLAIDGGVVLDSYDTWRFMHGAETNLHDRRAAATTKSGAPTRGRWVHFQLPLRIRDDSHREIEQRLHERREARKQQGAAEAGSNGAAPRE